MKKLVFLTLLLTHVAYLTVNAQSGTVGLPEWKFDKTTKTLTISGKGAMPDYPNYPTSSPFRSSIEKLVIQNGITHIGNYTFHGCKSLISVTLPNSVTSIGNFAFSECENLTSITIPNSVTSIGTNSFFMCSSLSSITIPNSVTNIGSGAFIRCSKLTSVIISNLVTSIELMTFSSCSNLTSVVIPNSVTSIGDAAFSGCSSLNSVTIPNSVTKIGWGSFRNSGLIEIINYATTPQIINSSEFDSVDKIACVLRVPTGSVEIYRVSDGWNDFLNIVEIR
jgi:hypothetical protein